MNFVCLYFFWQIYWQVLLHVIQVKPTVVTTEIFPLQPEPFSLIHLFFFLVDKDQFLN